MKEVPPYLSQLTHDKPDEKRYFFKSIGKKQILKAVIYSYAGKANINLDAESEPDIRNVYNLGFGDFNKHTNDIDDIVISNNGDARKVFSTVLDTAVDFFEKNPRVAIIVSGSDSDEQLSHTCRITCTKNCEEHCKNIDRRIRTYRGFVNSNFDSLIEEYDIFGLNDSSAEAYNVKNEATYSSVLLCQKD